MRATYLCRTMHRMNLIYHVNYDIYYLQINIIRMYRQLEYFQEYQRRVAAIVGEGRARQLVNQALVLITVGGNDFVNNYYLVPFSARSRQYPLPDYVKYLISEYKKLLQVCILSILYINPFTFIVYVPFSLIWFYMHLALMCKL